MVSNVRIGAMQAYMVAEPWNTRAIYEKAITGEQGIGLPSLKVKKFGSDTQTDFWE
jgi:hypothetical protein